MAYGTITIIAGHSAPTAISHASVRRYSRIRVRRETAAASLARGPGGLGALIIAALPRTFPCPADAAAEDEFHDCAHRGRVHGETPFIVRAAVATAPRSSLVAACLTSACCFQPPARSHTSLEDDLPAVVPAAPHVESDRAWPRGVGCVTAAPHRPGPRSVTAPARPEPRDGEGRRPGAVRHRAPRLRRPRGCGCAVIGGRACPARRGRSMLGARQRRRREQP